MLRVGVGGQDVEVRDADCALVAACSINWVLISKRLVIVTSIVVETTALIDVAVHEVVRVPDDEDESSVIATVQHELVVLCQVDVVLAIKSETGEWVPPILHLLHLFEAKPSK